MENIMLHEVREQIKKIYGEWLEQYTELSTKSRAEWMKGLKPGSTIPEDGRVYGEYWQNEFNEVTAKSLEAAMEVLDKEREVIRKVIAEAPSAEAMNVVELLKMRIPVEKIEDVKTREAIADEIDIFMSEYPNYSVYETLKALAAKAGILDFKEHEVHKKIEILDQLEKHIYKYMDAKHVIYNGVKDFDTSSFTMSVDNAGYDALLAYDSNGELPEV